MRALPAVSRVLPGAHLPWLGGLFLVYLLLVPVTLALTSALLSWVLCLLAASVLAASVWLLTRRMEDRSVQHPGWTVPATRDPELG